MVGVPGRSKGCHNCRRKKKGCDQKRPCCTPCLKSGAQCEGYYRQRVFVNSSDTYPRYKKSSSFETTKIVPQGVLAQRHQNERQKDILLPDSLAMTAGEQVVVAYFLQLYSPEGQHMSPWAWTASRATEPAPRQALLALSLSTLGEQHKDARMLAEGARLYGRALKEAAADMESPTKGTSDVSLVTISMMRLYEIFHGGTHDGLELSAMQSNNWRQHSSGTMAIFEVRTPWSFVDGLSHCLFVDSRLVIIIKAIHERKRTRLCEPEWKTVPWTKYAKTSKHILLDVLVEVPGLFEDIDRLREFSVPEYLERECNRLLSSCWAYDEFLTKWYDTLRPHTVSETEDTLLLYWTTRLFLYSSMNILNDKLGASQPRHLLKRVPNLQQYIDHLADAVPIFFESSARRALAIFPLGACLQFMTSVGHTDVDPSGVGSVKEGMMHKRQRLVAAVSQTLHGKAALAFLSNLQRAAAPGPGASRLEQSED